MKDRNTLSIDIVLEHNVMLIPVAVTSSASTPTTLITFSLRVLSTLEKLDAVIIRVTSLAERNAPVDNGLDRARIPLTAKALSPRVRPWRLSIAVELICTTNVDKLTVKDALYPKDTAAATATTPARGFFPHVSTEAVQEAMEPLFNTAVSCNAFSVDFPPSDQLTTLAQEMIDLPKNENDDARTTAK